MVIQALKDNATNAGLLYVFLFALRNYGKELFWGSVRNLKDIFTLTLIQFTMTFGLNSFMSEMSEFAKQDAYSGEGYYEQHLTLMETNPLNA